MVPAASARHGGGPARRPGCCHQGRQPWRHSKPCLLPGRLCWVLPISSLLGEDSLLCPQWSAACAAGVCWCSQSESAWQPWGKGTSTMALAGKRLWQLQLPWAGPAVEAQRCQQSKGMERNGLSLPLSVTDTVSLFSVPKENTS